MESTFFTQHAFDRVKQRLNLTFDEIAYVLDHNKFVSVGIEDKRLDHRLFFSHIDLMCFVAIQDITDGVVLTILPVDYHNSWKISHEAIELAKNIPSRKEDDEILIGFRVVIPKDTTEQIIKTYCYYSHEYEKEIEKWHIGNYRSPKEKHIVKITKEKKLDCFTSKDFYLTIDDLLKNKEYVDFINFCIKDNEIDIKLITNIKIKLFNKSPMYSLKSLEKFRGNLES